jgi:hypothetical protein
MDATTRFVAWLAEGGAVHALTIAWVDGERGVIAARDVAAGERVATIPRGLLVTRERVRASSVARQIRDANVALSSPHALFAAWLCVEAHGGRSDYAPYLAMLPDDFSGFPLHAAPADRAELTGTLAAALVDELATDVARDHAALVARVRLCRDLDLATFTRARLSVGSRVFALNVDDLDTTAMVPLGDLLNHDRAPATRWSFDADADAFTFTATRDLAAGAAVTNSYGDKANCRLLVQYGFALDDNPHDVALLCGRQVGRDPTDPAGQAVLTTLSDAAEAARAAIAAMPSTEADDAALLADRSLAPARRAIVQTRRGERAVLEAWRAHATR